MINILPEPQKEEIKKGTRRRVLNVCLWASFFTFILCSLFILPSYIMANSKLKEVTERRQVNQLGGEEESNILSMPRLINQKIQLALQNLNSVSLAERILTLSLAEDRGLSIKQISYKEISKGKTDKPAFQASISGTAADREALLSFERQIKEIDFVKSTTVPVSSFAKDKDIPFSMVIDIK